MKVMTLTAQQEENYRSSGINEKTATELNIISHDNEMDTQHEERQHKSYDIQTARYSYPSPNELIL
jgi:hypothetical protein